MKTLAMMKMEKNFIAQIDKRYPRKPYEHYSLASLKEKLLEEMNELNEALRDVDGTPISLKPRITPLWTVSERAELIERAKQECADVSNVIDYIFEALQK